jgi:hypothetical protein
VSGLILDMRVHLKKEVNMRTKKGEPFRTPLHETEVSIVA